MSDLTNLIGQCAADAEGNDAMEVARSVVAATPRGRQREFYAEALTPLVRIVLNNERNSASAAVRRGRTYSTKTQAMRSSWDRYLDTMVVVVGGIWKRMRDLTVEDLNILIKARESHIASVQEQVEYLRRIQSAMLAAGVNCVGDLKEEVQ